MKLPPFTKAQFSTGEGLLLQEDAAASAWSLVEAAATQAITLAEFAGPADSAFWNSESAYIRAVRPYDVRGGVLSIPIKGVLLADFPYAFGSYATGFDYLLEAVSRGAQDADVKGVAFMIDSPGGQVRDCMETADAIKATLQSCGKPSIALCACAASAAYAMASCADKIVVSKTGLVGSVGVIMTHTEFSKALASQGVTVTAISAGEGKNDGAATTPLSDKAKARMQERVDHLYGMFTGLVARHRGMNEKAVVAAGALTYYSEGAIKIGFADSEENLSAALAAFRTGADKTGDSNMTTQNTTQATAAAPVVDVTATVNAAVTAALTAERTRVSAILGCEEAKGRQSTATALANQGLALEVAQAILKTVPAEAAAPPVAPAAAAPGATFNAAMAQTPNPNVAVEGGAAGAQGEQRDHAKAVLAAMASETGIDYTKRA